MKTPKSFTASSEATRPSQDAIARRAYEIWVQEGRPDGCDHEHWREAERQLTAERGADNVSSDDGRQIRKNVRSTTDDKVGSKLEDVDSRYSSFGDDASLPAKVQRQVGNVGRRPSRRSATSLG